jgi:hypothetical protein
MNKYQSLLNSLTNLAIENHCMCVKQKYKPKWLEGGTPCDDIIHISYVQEFEELSDRAVRKIVKRNCKTSEDFQLLKGYFVRDNYVKEILLFGNPTVVEVIDSCSKRSYHKEEL